MEEKKTNMYPYRPPKKYPQKDLYGRARVYLMFYKDLKRFQKFYTTLFGWDMIESPEAASGIPMGSEHPTILIGTGPTQPDYEGAVPGHMNLFVPWAPGKLEVPGFMMEAHFGRPLEETIQKILDHGGTLVEDKNVSVLAKTPVDKDYCWEFAAVLKDPAGNFLYLWQCPSCRTWEEPETEYDRE